MEFDIRPWLVRLMPALPVVVAFMAAGPVKAQDLRPDVRVTDTNRRISPHYLLPSPPGWFGPGPGWGSWRGYGPGVGWNYYNTPGGPTTAWTGPNSGWWGYSPNYAVMMGNGFLSGPGGAPFGLGAGPYRNGYGYGYPGYGYGYGWGFGFPAATGSYWTNGNSLYGPPIPTYAPTPGAFGGSQAHKTYFMQNIYGSGYLNHNWFGYQRPTPPPGWERISVNPSTVYATPEYRVVPLNGKCARFQMKMPSADAELWIGKNMTKHQGIDRDFESPELDASKEYAYEFIARWTENGEPKAALRKVQFKAGAAINIDFTQEAE
jgi:uncharacterized protein (TIGR03000 family)